LRASEDDLKAFVERRDQFLEDPFHDTFYLVSEAMMTRPANISGSLEDARNPSPESDLAMKKNMKGFLDRYSTNYLFSCRVHSHSLKNINDSTPKCR
jgi:hypothetical protein